MSTPTPTVYTALSFEALDALVESDSATDHFALMASEGGLTRAEAEEILGCADVYGLHGYLTADCAD